MRCGAAWSDVYIKNMSSRGIMAEAGEPPTRGTYVEIRRGRQIVVGRVIWTRNGQFGVRTQDRLDVEAIVTEPRLTSRPQNGPAAQDRRNDPGRGTRATSPARAAERNRMVGKAMQFCILVVLGGAAALFIAGQVFEVLSAPLRAASQAMGGTAAEKAPPPSGGQ